MTTTPAASTDPNAQPEESPDVEQEPSRPHGDPVMPDPEEIPDAGA
jgi:hypothetical protein